MAILREGVDEVAVRPFLLLIEAEAMVVVVVVHPRVLKGVDSVDEGPGEHHADSCQDRRSHPDEILLLAADQCKDDRYETDEGRADDEGVNEPSRPTFMAGEFTRSLRTSGPCLPRCHFA